MSTAHVAIGDKITAALWNAVTDRLDVIEAPWLNFANPINGGITIGNGILVAKYHFIGTTCFYRGRITSGTSTTYSGGSFILNLPANAAAGSNAAIGWGHVRDTSNLPRYASTTGSANQVLFSDQSANQVTNTVPFTWTPGVAGKVLDWDFVFEWTP